MTKREMRDARARARARKKRNKKKYGSISPISVVGMVLVCLAVSLLLNKAVAAGRSHETVITLKAEGASVIQGETSPVFQAEAVCEEATEKILKKVLEKETGYTIQNLLDELNRGIGYVLECEGDGSKEGEYPIRPVLTSEITTPLYGEWFGKVKIETREAIFQVKNPLGEWKDGKFSLWEGGYLKEDFVTYKGKSYYLNEKGEKVTGWKEINGDRYKFSKKGVMKTGWLDEKDSRYYLDEQGRMCLGWLKLDDEKYYFDAEGKMLTGKQKIGGRKCVFAEDGRLESEENSIDPNKPMVALTFDDGPGPRTEELLDKLDEYGSRATFFMQGMNAQRYKDTVKKMAEIGCELGNHSYNHPYLTKLDAKGIQEQIGKTNSILADASGQRATVMRPPFGAINEEVKANAGMPLILWSIDTLDWKTRNTQSTIDCVMQEVSDGDIILMHDIHTESIDAALALIPKLIDEGYQLVTVSELADARNITMQNGGKYGKFVKVQ